LPDISLLQPTVLRGVVEKFVAPQRLTLLSAIQSTPWPYPSVTWDIIRGSRAIARPNVPNSEAHIVPRLGRSQGSASFLYLREKKVFEPTTLHWLRLPGTLAARNAEIAVMREINDINTRFDNFAEWTLWQSLTGTLSIQDTTGTGVEASVDYKFLPSHLPTVSTPWATATGGQIIEDIRSWKRLVRRDGQVEAKTAYASEVTMAAIYDAFSNNGAGILPNYLLSDRMKDQYYTTGTLPGFMGIDWNVQESVYDAAGAAYTSNPTRPSQETRFLSDGAIVFGNLQENNPVELMIGPSADDEAPENFTGKFSKTWKEKDPSARQFLLEWSFLPVITRPEQLVFVNNVL
jgi:hypothetical protein